MKQLFSLTLILSLIIPYTLPLNPLLASEKPLNKYSEIVSNRRRNYSNLRIQKNIDRNRLDSNLNNTRRNVDTINYQISRHGSRYGRRHTTNRINSRNIRHGRRRSVDAIKYGTRRHGSRYGRRNTINRINSRTSRYGRRRSVDAIKYGTRRHGSRYGRRNTINRINSRTSRYGRRNIINRINSRNRDYFLVNPRRSWNNWGWNGGSRWYSNDNYWGGGFWGDFIAGAVTLGITNTIVNSNYSNNYSAYKVIEKYSPGYYLFDRYGLSQVQCNKSQDLVFIYGPQKSIMCARPNSQVVPGYYNVDPENLVLAVQD